MGNTVKPLVWAPVLGTNERAHSDGLCYEVAQRTSSGEWFWWLQHIPHRLSVPFSTLEAAKAAAQADYEARILSALQPGDGWLGIARPIAEWHEDMGFCVWWWWTGTEWAGEPAWIGSPNCSDWPGYHTHFTPHPNMPLPAPPACLPQGEETR